MGRGGRERIAERGICEGRERVRSLIKRRQRDAGSNESGDQLRRSKKQIGAKRLTSGSHIRSSDDTGNQRWRSLKCHHKTCEMVTPEDTGMLDAR